MDRQRVAMDPDSNRRRVKAWAAANPERAKANTKRWLAENPKRRREKQREWDKRNRKARAAKHTARMATDPAYRLAITLRKRLCQILRGRVKSGSHVELLGCSPADAIAYLESRFVDGMTWANWGPGHHGAREWHVDHKRPLNSFDLTDPTQLAAACHYTNLQPLWAIDNIVKGFSVDGVKPAPPANGTGRRYADQRA